ncbi:hypothetical protein [Nocardia sp. NPDC005825]|uniref:hypothetical protein n=1 Tax=unclassified Nocardia TaxID=2637762 RepID=UPI0033CA86D0
MTTARVSAALASAIVITGVVAVGPTTAPAHAYGPASCVPGDPTRPTGELFATTNTATITDPADPRLNDRLDLLELDENFTALTELALPVGSQLIDGVAWSADTGVTYERSKRFLLACTDYKNLCWVADDLRGRYRQDTVLTFEYLPGEDARADDFTVTVTGLDRVRFGDALAANPAVAQRLGGGSFTASGELILVGDRADTALIRDFVTSLGGDWNTAEFRYGDREFVRSTGTAALACAV